MARASEQAPAKGAAGLQPPSFNAPDIVVAETDDAARFQTIDFKRSRTVYRSLYAPFISLLGRHYVDYDHKELPIFVVQAHLVTLSDMVFRVLKPRLEGTAPPGVPNLSRLSNSGYLTMRHLFGVSRFENRLPRHGKRSSRRRQFLAAERSENCRSPCLVPDC